MFKKLRFGYGRITWLLFLFIVVMLWLMARSQKQSDFAKGVEVTVEPLNDGELLISNRDVKQSLLMAFGNTLEGTELSGLDVNRMERVLEEDPFVKDAETYIDQNDILRISIEQREPILRILDNQGGNYYLDKEGKKMPPSKHIAARVLVATGNVTQYTPNFLTKKKSTLKDLFLLTRVILNDEFLAPFIQQIHINNAGEFVLIPIIGDQRIELGQARKIEDKIKRLKLFYREGMPYEGWRKYSSISVKYNGQVVCVK